MHHAPVRRLLRCLVLASLVPGAAFATERSVNPSMSQSQIGQVIADLKPGDTLSVQPGTYRSIDLDLINASGGGIAGTSSSPITIQGIPAADGTLPWIQADTSTYQEPVRLRSGCAYIIIQNLKMSAQGSTTQSGIHFDDNVHHITIRGNTIVHVTGIGIQIDSKTNVHDILIQDNEIADTGSNATDPWNGGQAFTAGGFWPDTATGGVYNIRLEHNLIHDITGQEGDCAKFMYGVYASAMVDNVMYACPRGIAQLESYGITSYGSGPAHYQDSSKDNVLSRNLLLDTAGLYAGEDNVAIWAGPGTRVENNVIVNANIGIAARLESEVSTMRNLRVVNNTVYGATDHAFSITNTQTSDSSVVVANNALMTGNTTGFGYRLPSPMGGMVAVDNYYQGLDWAEAKPPVMIPIVGSLSALFVKPTTAVPGADFALLPGTALVGVGAVGVAPTDDFDLNARGAIAANVGSYQGGSAHWTLARAFKGMAAAEPAPTPTPTPAPTPTPVPEGTPAPLPETTPAPEATPAPGGEATPAPGNPPSGSEATPAPGSTPTPAPGDPTPAPSPTPDPTTAPEWVPDGSDSGMSCSNAPQGSAPRAGLTLVAGLALAGAVRSRRRR